MTNKEGESNRIETTQGEWEKCQKTRYCQRSELSMGRIVRKWAIGTPRPSANSWCIKNITRFEHTTYYEKNINLSDLNSDHGILSVTYYTVSQEPQCARFRRVLTCSPIVSNDVAHWRYWDTVYRLLFKYV